MHNFINLKRGISVLVFLTAVAYKGYAQDVDTTQYSTDTTTVKAKDRELKGEKFAGKVTDGATGLPLTGASVSITGFSATITDENGAFNVTIPDYKATLQISSPGYHTKLYPFFKGTALTVILYPESMPSLFSVVSLPSGNKSMARTVGAIATQYNQGWTANSETPNSNLQGRLAGVNAIRRSGTPGIGADVFVRGFTSLYGTNEPLYVVDGLIYDVGKSGSSLTSGFTANALQHIDVRDITSVSVVKDAVHAGAYGTRAANGVVFITTNHATELPTKIDFSAYGGFNLSPRQYPVMTGNDFRTYLTDVFTSAGVSPAKINSYPFMTNSPIYANDTPWQDRAFRQGFDQNYYMQITGGDNVAKYSLSLGYTNDQGITDQTDYLRYNTRFNADLNLSKKLSGNVNLAFTYKLQDLKDQGVAPVTNPIFLSLVKAPFFNTNALDAFGNASPKPADADTLGVSNPRAILENAVNNNKNYRFAGSTNFNLNISKVFSAYALIGIIYDKTQETSFVPRQGIADTVNNFDVLSSRSGASIARYSGISTDARLNFAKVLNHLHNITASLGFRFNHNENEIDEVRGFNTATDELVTIGNSSSLNRLYAGNIGKWRTLNNYLTAEYSYADKYLLSGSVAIDGSSRFGKDVNNALKINGNSFAVLPAIGAAWIISSENFMKNLKNVDLLKLRLSYGLLGNDDIGNYTSRQTYSSQNLLGLQGLVRSNLANPHIQWEVVKKFNTGLDLSAFKERLSFSFDFWNNVTDKMVTSQAVNGAAVVAGIDSYSANNAGMRTRGYDLGINMRLLNGSVKWDAGFNIGSYKNKITMLSSADPVYTTFATATYITGVGQDANLFYGYRSGGVYATDADAATAGLSVRASNGSLVPFKGGDMRFADMNGDKVIDDADRAVIGNPNPDLFGSFNNTFGYKRWRLDALLTFISGSDVFNYTRSQLESESGYYNQTNAVINRWKAQGQVTGIPKAAYGDPMGNGRFSDRWIEDGSYVRLRTLALSYSFPFKAKSFKYLNIYGTANNVFTLSKYKGYDPEFSALGSVFAQGVDTTLEPQVRSFQLGMRLGL